MQLTSEELCDYIGGAVNATYINAIVRGITFLFDVGKSIGSSIRRGINGQLCPI